MPEDAVGDGEVEGEGTGEGEVEGEGDCAGGDGACGDGLLEDVSTAFGDCNRLLATRYS